MKFNSLLAGAIMSGLVAGSIAQANDTTPAAPAHTKKHEKNHCTKEHMAGKAMKGGKDSCNHCGGHEEEQKK